MSTASLTIALDFRGRCLGCGYQLCGLTVWRCPECGRAFDPRKSDTFAVTRPTMAIRWVRALGVGGACAAVLVWFMIPRTTGHSRERIVATEVEVVPGGMIALAIELHRTHAGAYLDSLIDLARKPDQRKGPAGWKGPYIKDPALLTDAWGQPLRYKLRGKHNPASYDLWSIGPDGQDGTEDDIGNW